MKRFKYHIAIGIIIIAGFIVSIILLFFLKELTKANNNPHLFALFSALLFAWHPMKVESVAWFNAGMIEIHGGNAEDGCKRRLRSYKLGYTASADSINKYCK